MTGKLVVAKGFDGCLYVYPADDYEAFVERAARQARTSIPRVRQLRRFFTTGAVEAELDSAGRISLPPMLREYARLTKDVAITGNGDPHRDLGCRGLGAYNGETESTIEDLARELADAGLL